MGTKPILIILALILVGCAADEGKAYHHRPLNLGKGPSLFAEQKEDKWLGEDKVKHLMVSTFLTGIGYRLCYDGFDCPVDRSRVVASSLTFSLGLGKELRDRTQMGEIFSFKDLVADLLGIGMGLLLFTSW